MDEGVEPLRKHLDLQQALVAFEQPLHPLDDFGLISLDVDLGDEDAAAQGLDVVDADRTHHFHPAARNGAILRYARNVAALAMRQTEGHFARRAGGSRLDDADLADQVVEKQIGLQLRDIAWIGFDRDDPLELPGLMRQERIDPCMRSNVEEEIRLARASDLARSRRQDLALFVLIASKGKDVFVMRAVEIKQQPDIHATRHEAMSARELVPEGPEVAGTLAKAWILQQEGRRS